MKPGGRLPVGGKAGWGKPEGIIIGWTAVG